MRKATSPTTWQEDVVVKWNEYNRTGFSKYVVELRKKVGNKTDGCVIVGSLQPCLGQAVNEMVPSALGGV